MRVKRLAVVVVVLALLLGACADREEPDVRPPAPITSPTQSAGTPSPEVEPVSRFQPASVQLALEMVASGLDSPLHVVDAGDGSGRLFVVEQGGLIRVIQDGTLVGDPLLDITHLTVGEGEQGLLGLAFHPRFERNGRLFVNHTDPEGDTVLASYQTSRDGSADADSRRVLLTIDQPYPNHNGGHLEFGPDGYLYIATGDGGGAGDPDENGQDRHSLLGKLLRIDVDAGDPYGIPADNPFAEGNQGAPEVWAYGLRNPWRFSFDEVAGTLWVGDVGQNELEEIDRVRGGDAGLDYGWDDMEGSECYEEQDCQEEGRVLPLTQYGHDEGCSVTGGFVYRGETFPDLQGAYLFGDYCSGTIWGVDAGARHAVKPSRLLSSDRAISSFGRDVEGELYVTDIAAGEVLRVVNER